MHQSPQMFYNMFQNWLLMQQLLRIQTNILQQQNIIPQKIQHNSVAQLKTISPTPQIEYQAVQMTKFKKLSEKRELISQSKIKKGKNKNVLEQYEPFKDVRKKIKCSYQNQNRNILPNTVHQLFSFLQKRSKSGRVVQKIFKCQQKQLNWTSERYYAYMKKFKEKLDNYVSEHSIKLILQLQQPNCLIYSENEQRFYCKVCRILMNYFVNQESNVLILTSKRMSNVKRKCHLQTKRYLKTKLDQLFKDQ